MTQPAMVAALQAGAVDGIVAGAPFSLASVANGSGVLWISGPKEELPEPVRPTSSSCLQTTAPASSSSIQTTGAYFKANRDTVRKLQQAIIAIAEFVEKEQVDAKRALAAGYPDLSAQEIDLAFKEQWRNWTKPFLNEADIRQELKLLISSTKAPGLQQIDPTSAMVGRL
jgi:ABC-type nitrate/sulfonate/bicarbonate transport system substrate-binding protein